MSFSCYTRTGARTSHYTHCCIGARCSRCTVPRETFHCVAFRGHDTCLWSDERPIYVPHGEFWDTMSDPKFVSILISSIRKLVQDDGCDS